MMEGRNKSRTKGARQEGRVEGRLPCLPHFPPASGKGKDVSEMLKKWDVLNIRKTGRRAKDYITEEHWSSVTPKDWQRTSAEKRLRMRSSLSPVAMSAPPATTDLSRHREGHRDTFHISSSQTFLSNRDFVMEISATFFTEEISAAALPREAW